MHSPGDWWREQLLRRINVLRLPYLLGLATLLLAGIRRKPPLETTLERRDEPA
jgi:hypothetical protein